MSGSFYLAWKYSWHHRGTTAVLIAAITLIAYLPLAVEVIVENAGQHFRSRSETTPLVVGPRGSPLELVLATLYFEQPHELVTRMEEFERIDEQNVGRAIPMHLRFSTRDCPIVGTSVRYMILRRHRVAEGDKWNLPGECLVGSRAAERLNVDVGARIPVSASSAFLLDNPPLRLRVAGILAPTETADDDAIFVELETSWILEGLGHGHAAGARHGSPEAELYTDITAENAGSVHFHGDPSTFPISSIIVVPDDEKAETLLLGQYLSPDDTAQIARPREVMDALLARVLMVRSYLIALVGVISLVTLLTIALVIVLSIRLRRDEIATISKMGCSRGTIASILVSQVLIILAVSALTVSGLTLLTDAWGRELAMRLIL